MTFDEAKALVQLLPDCTVHDCSLPCDYSPNTYFIDVTYDSQKGSARHMFNSRVYNTQQKARDRFVEWVRDFNCEPATDTIRGIQLHQK